MLALEGYKAIDWVSDKEFYFAMEKYRCERELDIVPPVSDQDIQEMYNEGFVIEDEDFFEDNDY